MTKFITETHPPAHVIHISRVMISMQVTCIKCHKHGSLSLNQYKSNGHIYKYYGIQHYDSDTKKRRWCYLGTYESLPDQYKTMIHKRQELSTTYPQNSRISETLNLRVFYEKQAEKLVAQRRLNLRGQIKVLFDFKFESRPRLQARIFS
ncbi:MAG: hypothetical protein ACFFCW_43125 [Candidatus Hodarchaeota archaeon]